MSQRLSAIDALVRGFANLRANRELVLMQLASVLIVALATFASLLPLGFALGIELRGMEDDPLSTLARFLDPALWFSNSVLLALVLGLVIGTAAIAVYSWFQAGIYGVLVSGDRQAGRGEGRPSTLFRTFSWADFSGWAGRGLYRFFAWYQLYLLAATLLVGLLGLLAIAALRVGLARGPGAGIAVGCGGLLPLFALMMLCSLWFAAAKADLAREDSSAVASWRRGARVVGARIGTSLLLLLLFVVASSAAGMLMLPLQMVSEIGLKTHLGAYIATQIVVTGFQWLVGSVLGLVYGATFVALVRDELPDAAG